MLCTCEATCVGCIHHNDFVVVPVPLALASPFVHVLSWKAKRTAVLLLRYRGSARLLSRKRPRRFFTGMFPEGNHNNNNNHGIYSAPVTSRT